jgi:hypothetical protein
MRTMMMKKGEPTAKAKNRIRELVEAGAVCVVIHVGESFGAIGNGPCPVISTYRPGMVDANESVVHCNTRDEVLMYLADDANARISAVVPVALAHELFGWHHFAPLAR